MSEVTHRLATKESIEALATTISSQTAAISALPNATQEAADAATAAAAEALAAADAISGNIAPNYSATASYMVGQYVTYDGGVYRCISQIVGGESWTAAHWEQVSIGTDLGSVCIESEANPLWNLIDEFPAATTTKRSITFSKKSSGVFHVQGIKSTGSETQEFVLYRSATVLPKHFYTGGIYNISVSAGDAFVWLSAYFNDTYSEARTLFRSLRPLNGEQSGSFVIPEDCTGIGITIHFDDASSFNEDVRIFLAEQVSSEKRKAITSTIFLDTGDEIDSVPNIISGFNVKTPVVNGIMATKTGNSTYYLKGTRTQEIQTTIDLYRSRTVMPNGFEAGKTYVAYLKSVDASFWIIRFDGDEDTTGTTVWKSENNKHGEQYAVFTLPETGIQGMSLAIKAGYANTYDETVTIYICEVKSATDQAIISSVYGYPMTKGNKKLFSLGNSFLTGAVYQNYVWVSTCKFKDAIYGQIAMQLGISEEDTTHIFHGSTGLISPHPQGTYPSFVETIEDTDLTPYDFLLTHCNGADLAKPLGTVDDDEEDETVAGGVVRVVNHIKSSNGLCKLILLGTPPYNSNIAGENVFITPTGGGNTIDDMDNLMYALSLKYHFIYVSWQDLEISYHYMDFCDYHEGDTGLIHANSPAVYRALGNYAALQMAAVSSQIAISKQMKNLLTE